MILVDCVYDDAGRISHAYTLSWIPSVVLSWSVEWSIFVSRVGRGLKLPPKDHKAIYVTAVIYCYGP
jgi:hypothetical protein